MSALTTAIVEFWQQVFGVLSLNPAAFQPVLPGSSDYIALAIVLLAGLSQAIGQGTVLFLNRVKPMRFLLSLLFGAVLFTAGVVFWALSTWLVAVILLGDRVSLLAVGRALGLSFAPQLLSFLIALPYLGVPLSIGLSIWSFLAFLIGLQATLGGSIWQAFLCGVLGGMVFQVLQRTIGRPVVKIGRWLRNSVAGVAIVTDLKALERVMTARVQRFARARRPPQP